MSQDLGDALALMVAIPRARPGVPLEALVRDLSRSAERIIVLIEALRGHGVLIEETDTGYICAGLRDDLVGRLGL